VCQLLSRDVPYSKVLSKKAVYREVLMGVNPRTLSNDIQYPIPRVDLLWQMLEHCWMQAPLRPTISEVKEMMQSFDL